MPKVGFLGPEGTFSHEAAIGYFGKDAVLVPWPTIHDLIVAVDDMKLDMAIVPIENSLEGAVNAALDTLALEVDLHIAAEFVMPINNNLLVHPSSDWREVTDVYTHPQPAGQCRQFLESQLPQARIHLTYSTAEGAKTAKAAGIHAAAVGPRQAARLFGLEIAVENIEDAHNNFTRFVVLGKTSSEATGRDKTSIVFTAEHKPGSLYRILDILNLWDVNMTKIESRPAKEKLGSYIFFVDMEGHASDPDLANALLMIQRKTTFYKFLGSYPRTGNQ